jgi:hypothetical protein
LNFKAAIQSEAILLWAAFVLSGGYP